MMHFFVGFMSAFIFPTIKVYQNGINFSQFEWGIFLGSIIPTLLMAVLVGLYAFIIERKETDMKKLFRNCIALPALLVSLVGGGGMIAKAKDIEVVTRNKNVWCKPQSKLKQGVLYTMDSLSNKKRVRFYTLSEEKRTDDFIVVDEVQYFIIDKKYSKPKTGLFFDIYSCELGGKDE